MKEKLIEEVRQRKLKLVKQQNFPQAAIHRDIEKALIEYNLDDVLDIINRDICNIREEYYEIYNFIITLQRKEKIQKIEKLQ